MKNKTNIDLSYCADVIKSHIKLFEIVYADGEVTDNIIKKYVYLMSGELVQKYNITDNVNEVRRAYRKELTERINEVI